MIIVESPEGFRTSAQGRPRAFVPTMGALHEGHRSLMRAARDQVGTDGEVVVSVFVNPTQFGANEDFDRYPRTFDADARACESEGVDILYAPAVEGIYGPNPSITVHPGPLASELEGSTRPGHFAGVLTVVAILLHQVAPTHALFGEKDYQQLELITRMCLDLSFPVSIVAVPTSREADGLARSSRNAFLSPVEREQASAIPRALDAGVSAAAKGADAARVAALFHLDGSGLRVDYVEVRDRNLGPAPHRGEARLLVAAYAGDTRLIDNCRVDLGDGGSR